jgi:hypothetical protein
MFRNTPRSPTDLSPAQLVFGRHLRDSLPFSRQMLRPQNQYEIKKRRLEINDGQHHKNDSSKRHKNDSSKRQKLSLLRPGQRVRFQDPITKKWTLTGKVTGFGETDRDYWVKDDEKAHCYRRNRRFIKPIDIEATSPPKQPVQAPAPARTESGNIHVHSLMWQANRQLRVQRQIHRGGRCQVQGQEQERGFARRLSDSKQERRNERLGKSVVQETIQKNKDTSRKKSSKRHSEMRNLIFKFLH